MTAPKLTRAQRNRTLTEATSDMDRALREHEPNANVARCSCGNIAMAIVQNDALGTRYVRCLACGANVLLRFSDAGRVALRGKS